MGELVKQVKSEKVQEKIKAIQKQVEDLKTTMITEVPMWMHATAVQDVVVEEKTSVDVNIKKGERVLLIHPTRKNDDGRLEIRVRRLLDNGVTRDFWVHWPDNFADFSF